MWGREVEAPEMTAAEPVTCTRPTIRPANEPVGSSPRPRARDADQQITVFVIVVSDPGQGADPLFQVTVTMLVHGLLRALAERTGRPSPSTTSPWYVQVESHRYRHRDPVCLRIDQRAGP